MSVHERENPMVGGIGSKRALEQPELKQDNKRRAPLGDRSNQQGSSGDIKSQPLVPNVVRESSSRQAFDVSLDTDGILADVTDVDSGDVDNILCVSEYAHEIFKNLMIREKELYVPVDYFANGTQFDINASMRGVVVDWLVDVADEYQLMSETLHLSVVLMDKFLSKVAVVRTKLQLVGITCMLIASKIEEIYAPQVQDYVYITDNAYTREEMLAMEGLILSHLNFQVIIPTVKNFVRRWIKVADADMHVINMARYLSEVCLEDMQLMTSFYPSMIAAAVVLLSRGTAIPSVTSKSVWSDTLAHYTGYKYQEVHDCAKVIVDALVRYKASNLNAIREKYSHADFENVSAIEPKLL